VLKEKNFGGEKRKGREYKIAGTGCGFQAYIIYICVLCVFRGQIFIILA
jgi:purine-nucleoside phosphorylase